MTFLIVVAGVVVGHFVYDGIKFLFMFLAEEIVKSLRE